MPGPRILLLTLALSVPAPALADPGEDLKLPPELDRALRQMMEQLKPALGEMFRLMEQFEGVDDPRNYQLPEVLPNGDIIIRRRPDAPPYRGRPGDAPGTRT